MSRLVIAIDCDDVLVPTVPALITWYNKTYGTTLTEADFYVRDPKPWNVDNFYEAVDRTHGYMRTPEFNDIAPFSEAVDAVRALAANHELHLITGRSISLEPYTTAFLTKYFSGCFTSIEHTGLFDVFDTQSKKVTKGEICAKLNVDVLIDDHLAHGRDVLTHGVREVLLFGDYAWNQQDQFEPGVTRCNDWEAVLQNVDTISHEL